jgi:hypothetical protein
MNCRHVAEPHAGAAFILVPAYVFTSAPMAKALMDAHKRRAQVEAMPEQSNRPKTYSAVASR